MTKGQIESQITESMTRFEREFLGKGPQYARTFIFDELVVVRLKGLMSQAEMRLCKAQEGIDLFKQMRSKLVEDSSDDINRLIAEACGCEVISMHTDISSRTGERVFVFTMERNLEEGLGVDS